jgi:hypothetical protein
VTPLRARRGRIRSLYALTATSAIVGCGAIAAAAAALTPPAVAIADRYLTLTAIFAGAAIVTAAATARRPLERPQRLAVVVAVLTAAGSWYWARTWVHEKQFDYLVETQTRELGLTALELSGDIVNFLHERAAEAPPRPAAETWDRDVAANLTFDSDTSVLFEQRFGGQVRRTRDLFALEGLTDRDLDVFYRRPANAFQIEVVARRLDALARRLTRRRR